MPDANVHPAALSPNKLSADCRVQRTRRSGPGGQHRNKVETAVVVHHLPTGVKAEAAERRSQAENRSVAYARLRVNLALEVRLVRPDNQVPSALWRSRLVGGKIEVGATHDDFPTMLAEALDVLADCRMDAKAAAERLECGISQLVKFLKKEPRALAQVNAARREAGRPPLR